MGLGGKLIGKKYNNKLNWPAKAIIDTKGWSYLQRKYHLTPRELQLAICICRGCDNKQAAEMLDISVNTEKVYLASIYKKVRVNNKVSLLLQFLEDIKS